MREVSKEQIKQTRESLAGARRIVVKIGSNVLVGAGKEAIDRSVFCAVVEEISKLDGTEGREIFLVSSGAIAVARREIETSGLAGEETIAVKQALAAIGQPRLMHLYSVEFALYEKKIAQVLISPENLGERQRFLNARNTLRSLGEIEDIIPIINENDTTSTAEIRIGDNDSLAAQALPLMDADLLIILSDVDALYTEDPQLNPKASRIPAAYSDDDGMLALAKPADPNGVGSGGMRTKLKAARIAGASGVPTVIAEGRRKGVLQSILQGEDLGTLFVPGKRRKARKTWLEFASRPSGTLRVDKGAATALREDGRSLLSVGVVEIDGEFSSGAVVNIVDSSGTAIGRGLANYSSSEVKMIAGKPSDEIRNLLGFSNGDAVVHRDDFALVSAEGFAQFDR